jgi:hypothetical protein
MTQVGIAYSEAGELDRARPLLERVIRDTGRPETLAAHANLVQILMAINPERYGGADS